jgi:elongation factor 1 alpha-like protein
MLSTFVPIQPLPQLKLLGGSSKLAKLAEERRKKAAAARGAQSAPADSLSSLTRLSISSDAKENEAPVPKAEPKKYPMRRKRSPTPPPREPTPPPQEPEEQLPDLRSSPTAFAQTFSTGSANPNGTSKMGLQDLFGSSYSFKVFEGPSPDDTVIQRQQGSKGLNK